MATDDADNRTGDGSAHRPTPVAGPPASLVSAFTDEDPLLRLHHRGAVGVGQLELHLAENLHVHGVGRADRHLLGDDRFHDGGIALASDNRRSREPLHDGLRRCLGLRRDRLLRRVGTRADGLRRVDNHLPQHGARNSQNEGQDGPNDAIPHSSTSSVVKVILQEPYISLFLYYHR